MFDLNVEVQGPLGAIKLLALLIGTLITTLNIVSTTSVMLFAARTIALTLKTVQVLIIEAFYLESLH
jgi:hypothetical protein